MRRASRNRPVEKLEVKVSCPECGTTFSGSSTTSAGDKIIGDLAHKFLDLHTPPCKFARS